MSGDAGRPSALIYVQHLLGVGHLARIARIARALRDDGVRTIVVRGGMPLAAFDVPGVETIQLDPVRANPAALSQLIGADGTLFDEARLARRRDDLLRHVGRLRPDLLLIEAFPFGRRAMRFELVPLLEQARSLGVRIIAASVRDILQENRKPGRAEEAAELIMRRFDLVLVHGEETLTPLGATFPLADRISGKTVYTGLVAPELPPEPICEHDVIVSVGGGAVGGPLVGAALAASGLGQWAATRWLVLAGPNMADASFDAFTARCPPNVDLRRFVPDLPARLSGARLSISQAGYNTVADILVARCASVLVPFEGDGETEQVTRARLLSERGAAVMVREAALSADVLGEACARAITLARQSCPHALDGAKRTAEILLRALAADKNRAK